MTQEEKRNEENASVLAKVSTAAFPVESLAPWMSDYDKKMEALIVGIRTVADVAEELDRQVWLLERGNKPKPKTGEEDIFDPSELHGAAYIFAFGLNRLALNMHNHAPSIDGKRTRQAIALARANNPGIAGLPGEEKKQTAWEKIKSLGRSKPST